MLRPLQQAPGAAAQGLAAAAGGHDAPSPAPAGGAPAQALRLPLGGGGGADEEWHMVSPQRTPGTPQAAG
jgi:hypothetical protein